MKNKTKNKYLHQYFDHTYWFARLQLDAQDHEFIRSTGRLNCSRTLSVHKISQRSAVEFFDSQEMPM